jgi:hypothetical protein
MSDPENPGAAPAAPAAAPAPNSAEAPLPSPVAAPSAAEAGAVVSPAAAPAADTGAPAGEIPAVVEPAAPGAETALKPHTETPGLLGQDAKPAEPAPAADKPAEAKPDGETPPADGEPPAVEPPKPLSYEPPTIPEGITLDPERIGAADAILGAAQVAPEVRQQLVDFHVGEMQRYDQAALQRQHDAFAEMKGGWAREVRSDPELGGAGFNTTIERADRMIRTVFPNADERTKFVQMLNFTGADSHPEMVRFLSRLDRRLGEPAPPPTDIGVPRFGPKGVTSANNGTGAGRVRARDLYDNPRSQEVLGTGGNGRG